MCQDYSNCVREHGYLDSYLDNFSRVIHEFSDTYDQIVNFGKIINNSDLLVRDMPLHPSFGIPVSTLRYLSENESEYLQNQLLYTKLTSTSGTSQQEVTPEHVATCIATTAQALQETAEWIYNPSVSNEERLNFMLNMIQFPYGSRFPYIRITSPKTGLKWGITLALLQSQSMSLKPCLIVPYYGNTIVMIITDPASHASTLVFYKLDTLHSDVESIENATEDILQKIKKEKDNPDLCVDLTGMLSIHAETDFLLVPKELMMESAPIIHTLLNRIICAMVFPTFLAYSKCPQDDEQRVMQESAELLNTYIGKCALLRNMW